MVERVGVWGSIQLGNSALPQQGGTPASPLLVPWRPLAPEAATQGVTAEASQLHLARRFGSGWRERGALADKR